VALKDITSKRTPCGIGRCPEVYEKDNRCHPPYEHDARLGLVAYIKGKKSHRIIQDGLKILLNLEHRGATGANPLAGDGAGILVQIPHQFLAAEAERLSFGIYEEQPMN